jgi:hypothetical protein
VAQDVKCGCRASTGGTAVAASGCIGIGEAIGIIAPGNSARVHSSSRRRDMSVTKRLAILTAALTVFLMGALMGVRPWAVPVVEAGCTNVPAGGFVWTIDNVPYLVDQYGDPGTPIQWDTAPGFIGALVKAKYDRQDSEIWYCAHITGINTVTICPNINDNPFPAGVLSIAGQTFNQGQGDCPAVNADDMSTCITDIQYALTFAKFDGPGLNARMLAQTYYWVDDSNSPPLSDLGDCDNPENNFQYVNSGPIYGNPCSAAPSADCYFALYEPGAR